MDQEVIDLAIKYCHDKKHVTPADVLAVIERESGGVAIFNPDAHLYRDNLAHAKELTGLQGSDIVRAVAIEYGPMKGQLSKFRCEPGYLQWAQRLKFKYSNTDRFFLSCSFGLGQKMARWLVTGSPQEDWIGTIKQFIGNKATQVMYVAGDLEALLKGSKDDRALAYTRYNAGPGAEHVSEYGADVYARCQRFKKLLEDTHYKA